MEIPFKARVQCVDGPAGLATHVVVHPATRRVTHLVVKERRSPHVERLVPFKFVQATTADQIHLWCSQKQLSGMQQFLQTSFVDTSSVYMERIPAGAWTSYSSSPRYKKVQQENIPEDELAVDAGTRVRATDGNVGRIRELMVDPESGSITHIMLKEGRVWAPRAVAIPISEVDRVIDRVVCLRMNRAGIKALPVAVTQRR